MRKATVRSLRQLSRAISLGGALVLATAAMGGCADENDPKTWVKRLDDPAQRAPAIKRLEQFVTDASRDEAKTKQLKDDAIEPLTKAYLAGNLDDKTRKDLIKLLGDMGDNRAAPAYAKAFKEFEPGKTDDDVKYSAQGVMRIVNSKQPVDEALAGALWDCFAKFQPSKNTKSINLVKDLQGAVMAVKHPSYGAKAVEKLSAPVTDPKDPAQGMDQIQFWQSTSARLIGDLKFTPGIKPLVKVLLTPTKADLIFPVRLALSKMPKEAEPVLIAALKGTDPDLAELAKAYPDKGYIPRVAEPLAYISRPAGKDATVEALNNADNDTNRTILATDLTHYPSDANLVKAYLAAYNKIDGKVAIPLLGGGNAHAIIAQGAANFFDPSLTEWLVKETAAAKGEAADAMPPAALQAAIKLMTPAQSKTVSDQVNKIPGKAIEKDMFESANKVLDKCKADTACYLGVLDTPVPSNPPAAKMGHVKAAWMLGINGKADTRNDIVTRIEKVKDGSVRLALAEALDHLSPTGDVAIAEKLEKIVEADEKAGTKAASDEIFKVALKLRSRAQ